MGLKANILVQEFVKEAGGADIRCLVIGGKVVAAMKRQGAEGEFRSNLHRGGSAEVVKLSKAERDTAIKAAKAMGLNMWSYGNGSKLISRFRRHRNSNR